MPLTTYRKKRDFKKTPEPKGRAARPSKRRGPMYVIQKHAASHLHYDFRLELDGVLKSWAVPKGPSLNPADKRLAVEVEDHPVEYGDFEGTIPKGEYGGGSVLLWDRGTWSPVGDPHEGLRKGRFSFQLHGEKLQGKWLLVRMKGRDEDRKPTWLLFKERDAEARTRGDVLVNEPQSVKTGRTLEEVGSNGKVWHSNRPAARSARFAASRSNPARPTPATRATSAKSVRSKAAPRTPRIPPMQLATLVTRAPEGDDWIHEIKYDGYRALCRLTRGSASFLMRSGQDWTSRFADLAEAAERLEVDQAVLDGEIVVVEPDGRTSFQALQNSMGGGGRGALVYYAFDLLSKDGEDRTKLPLEERKAALAELLASSNDAIRYSDHVAGNGPAVYDEACRRGLEGIISKRRDAPYRGGRVGAWLKVKCTARQELVIVGFTDPQGSRSGFGALLLGVRDGASPLRYAGRVGTGFTHESLVDLTRKLRALETKEVPVTDAPRSKRGVHWVEPKLLAEVAFTGWTDDGKLRHPSFQGLREDKKTSQAKRERPVPPPKPTRKGPPKRDPGRKTPLRDPPHDDPKHPPVREPPDEAREATVAGVVITHPTRVLFPEAGITKRDLASYMEAVAERMLPHVDGRPLMLVRCPDGRTGGCFFQKHPGFTVPPAVRQITVRESKGNATYLSVSSTAGLVGLIQVGVIEIHVWGAREDRQEAPDRLVFDLDPDPSVPWPRTIRAALDLRERLRDLGLESFPKTTGGKGLHVVVPFRRGPSWEDVARVGTAVGASMIQEAPDQFTATLSKARRHGKILIDTLRNRRGATWVAPYSPRAREGAPVSMPLAWSEVTPKLRPGAFTVRTAAARLRTKDPWGTLEGIRQSLPKVRV
jgi:bifunctional non-homologous end joining protein LigD